MKAGHTCALKIVNELPAPDPAEGCTNSSEQIMNMMHCVDVTNVRTKQDVAGSVVARAVAGAQACRITVNVLFGLIADSRLAL